VAVTDAYATAAEYRTGITPPKTDTGSDGEILIDLTAVTRWTEQQLGRFFTKDASAVARDFVVPASGPIYAEAENPWKFAGKASSILHLDTDLVSVSSIVTDDNGDGTPETTWLTTDYTLLPTNSDKGPEPRPYSAIAATSYGAQYGWPTGRLVRVTGVWGWPAIPVPVKRAVINMTAILRIESPRATQTINDAGDVLGMSADCKNIVRELARVYTRGSF
jgi:hypothetical protein